MFSHKSDLWTTPQKLFDELNEEFHFTLDVAASPENAKCKEYFTEEDNGLQLDWDNHICFMNPPYSQISEWIKKASIENAKGTTVICLIPSRTDTRYWHQYIWNKATHRPYDGVEVRFLQGRLKFSNSKNSAPFPSCIVVFRPMEPFLYRQVLKMWQKD